MLELRVELGRVMAAAGAVVGRLVTAVNWERWAGRGRVAGRQGLGIGPRSSRAAVRRIFMAAEPSFPRPDEP